MQKRKRWLIVPTLVMAHTLFGPLPGYPLQAEGNSPTTIIRVQLSSRSKRVGVSSPGGTLLLDEKTGTRLAIFHRGSVVIITPKGGKLFVNGYEAPVERVLLKPLKPEELMEINKRPYRGHVSVSVNKRGRLSVVNVVDVEEYLYGLIPHEISPAWGVEALKAQAIVARTYALYKSRNGGRKGYHLTANQYDQVYRGYRAEDPRANEAVDSTKGMVLTSGGRLVQAFYHATCGGVTAETSEVWAGTLDHSKSVKCDFCLDSPYRNWSAEYDLKDLTERFKKMGYDIGEIKRIVPVRRGPSGRVQMLLVDHAEGTFIINANKFRVVVGPKVVRSTLFDILSSRDKLVVKGHGWGHGVGLCQWGAKGMAEKGFSFRDIINFYYKDVEVIELSSLADEVNK